jgi:hypothetical protein
MVHPNHRDARSFTTLFAGCFKTSQRLGANFERLNHLNFSFSSKAIERNEAHESFLAAC